MALTDAKPRSLKADVKPCKLSDGFGLSAYVRPRGSVLWRWNYRFAGKQKTLALGTYPLVSLSRAREKRDEARKMLAGGTDPGENRRIEKLTRAASAATTFGAITGELKDKKRDEGKAEAKLDPSSGLRGA